MAHLYLTKTTRELFTTVQWKKIREMALEYNYGKMDLLIREIGFQTNPTDEGDLSMSRETLTKETGEIKEQKERALFISLMEA